MLLMEKGTPIQIVIWIKMHYKHLSQKILNIDLMIACIKVFFMMIRRYIMNLIILIQ